MLSVVKPRNENSSAPESASGTEPGRMMNGSRKLSNCAASTRIDQDRREQERAEELAALGAQLPRLAGVVDRVALRQDPAGLVLEERRAPGRARRPAGSTPWMRTALSCWKRFSSRGSVVVCSVAKVDSGTSLPSGAASRRSACSWSGVRRSLRLTCGMTL